MNDTTTDAETLAHERANWPADAVILEAVQLRTLINNVVHNMDALASVVQDNANPNVPGSIERAAGAMTAIGMLRDYVAAVLPRIDAVLHQALREWDGTA